MSLVQQEFLILDCQTTGMRPSVGHLLEIAWAWGRASSPLEQLEVRSHLIRLPEGHYIPPRVQEITGIADEDLELADGLEDVLEKFRGDLQLHATTSPAQALIHYAQFEEPFLKDFLKTEELPFNVLCSHKLARRLFPKAPSRNIRGLTGFFGTRLGEIKRASSHVQATFEIWRGLVAELERQGVASLAELEKLLSEAPKKPARKTTQQTSYEYRVEKAKRLALPSRPGIYRMIARSGEILYVGKATSLKDRVNSYFRGKRGRDPRKLEMMAQVWDLEFVETPSALEAALLESDEIKRLDPPYNVSLKAKDRRLVFYSRDFSTVAFQQNEQTPLGPFRRFNAIEDLRVFDLSRQSEFLLPAFHDPIPHSLLQEGFVLFRSRHDVSETELSDLPAQLALGARLLRELELADAASDTSEVEAEEGSDAEQANDTEEARDVEDHGAEEILSPDDVADKIERLFRRAARESLRARIMTDLLFARVRWEDRGGWRSIVLRNGRLVEPSCSSEGEEKRDERKRELVGENAFPWRELQVADFDRMSVLLSEISRVAHEISPMP